MALSRVYGKLTLQDGRWIISEIPPHVSLRLKSFFKKLPKTATAPFSLPDTTEMAAEIEWFMQRYPLDASKADRAFLIRKRELFENEQADFERILQPGYAAPPRYGFRVGFELYDGQKQAVELWRRRKALLLADDVGLGKSYSALGGLVGSDFLPASIIVPPHLSRQWVKDFIQKSTFLSAHVIDGRTPYRLPAANVYIFKYSIVDGWTDIAATGFFKSVVYDEIHSLRAGIKTEKGKACMEFSNNAEMKLGLSATPIFNYGDEAFNIMQYIDHEVLGTWEEFIIEWCSWNGKRWLVNDPDALGSYLREQHVFLRRIREGRPINRLVVDVPFESDEADRTEDLARALAMKVISGSFVERGQAARELDALARRVTGVGKARGVAAYTRILLESGMPVILAGWHRDVYEIWLKELKDFKPVMYTGSETAKHKQKSLDAFDRGDTNLFIISLRSGEGIDGLQKRCSTVVVGELDWSPQIYEQLFGRVDRPGQKASEITAVFCVADEGSDPIITQVNGVKRHQARGITDPGAGPMVIHTDESKLRALAERYLEKV